MNAEDCADPRFVFVGGWWGPCTVCGHVAWDHPQADIMADLRNQVHASKVGKPPSVYPPQMRKD